MSKPTDDRFSHATNAFLKNIWGDRALGMDVPEIDWSKPLSHADILYLLNLYPFIQIINVNPVWETTIIPQFREAPSGWVIHDYGQAMSSSPGKYLYGPNNPELNQDEEGDSGHGTIIKQAFITAESMVIWAIKKAWSGLEIIAGTDFMKWAVWVAAQEHNFLIQNFEPTAQDREKYNRIRRLKAENPGLKKAQTPNI